MIIHYKEEIAMKSEKHHALREAETKATQLFKTVEDRGYISAGKTETDLNTQVYETAFELFGIKKYWHKRIVRAGKNTLLPYRENPPNLKIKDNDILFFDFGPVFEDMEADFGRTYVLGDDEKKLKLKNDIESAWYLGKMWFDVHPNCTGKELFTYVSGLAADFGWKYGQEHCGHLIGNFPHEKIQGEEVLNYIHPDNRLKMSDPDKNGLSRDWILEVHFIDEKLEIGGFFEQLLTVD
jgi:Xaa-Pro dipeptidase